MKKGEILAFTGQSGCGKSTLLKLLLCVYRPQEGRIELVTEDGALPLTAEHRRLFAFVPQGNLLLDGTIRDAVSFAAPERAGEDEAIWEALHVACADFVKDLPEGLETRLLERGAGLSEGQLQRLAIARAIFSESPREGSVPIETEYHILAAGDDVSLLKIRLITGKSHQIRAHLAAKGYPILGDPKYGDREINRRMRKELDVSYQMLHAYEIDFDQHYDGLVITDEMPDIFRRVLNYYEMEI